MTASLLNYSSSQLEKAHVLESERATLPRFDGLGLNANEKTRLEINRPTFEKRFESNTLVENKRLEPNTHIHGAGNFETRLDGHLNHMEKDRIEGILAEKNVMLDKSRIDVVHLDNSRSDGIPVHMLSNTPLSSHLDKRTLDVLPIQTDKCLDNVLAPISLDKRKDSHSSSAIDKGRSERESGLIRAPVSSPVVAHSGIMPSQLHTSNLSSNPIQQAVHQGSNVVSHKSIHPNQMYQSSIRTNLHNPGLPSQNGLSLQFPPKKPLVTFNSKSPPVKPMNMPVPPHPVTTSSVSPVISNSSSMSTAISLSASNSGISNNISTTFSLSSAGTGSNSVSGIMQHNATLHPLSHVSNPRGLNESTLPLRPGSSPQPGSGTLRMQNDPLQSGARAATPLAQHQILPLSHSASHVGSQAVHGRITPSKILSSSAPSTSITTTSNNTNSNNSDLSITNHSAISLHVSTHSGSSLFNHGGTQGPGSPSIHSGYSTSLPGASFPNYSSLYGAYSSSIQHSPYLPPRVEPPVIKFFFVQILFLKLLFQVKFITCL